LACSVQSAYDTDWQLLAAASFIALAPVLAAFVLLQRFFVAGSLPVPSKGEATRMLDIHVVSHTHWIASGI